MIQTYCENASSAIIYLSLTGSREGKIISNNPPVRVYIGLFTEWKIQGIEFKRIRDSNGIIQGTPINKQGVIYSGIAILEANEYFYWDWISLQNVNFTTYDEISANANNQQNQTSRQLFKTPNDHYYQADIYNNIINVFESSTMDGIAIWDDDGTLYTRRNVEGLNINYSVQCQNCAQGECAGGDGKGGVICMDCESMQNDVNAAIRSYR